MVTPAECSTPRSKVAPALIRQRARQGLYIVPDHVNVSGRVAVFGRQTVGIERSADRRAGLGRYPAHQPGVTEVLQENRRNFPGSDLGDDNSDIAGAGLGLGGYALRRDE